MKTRRFRNCWERPRREQCELIGKRMQKMGLWAAANAWFDLGRYLEDALGEKDMPKYQDLICALRAFTIQFKAIEASLRQRGYNMDEHICNFKAPE